MVGRKKFDDSTNGKIGTPSIGPGVNKLPPVKRTGGKGASDDKDNAMLGQDDSDDEKIMARVRSRFNRCSEAESENRKAELDDKKFLTGEGQWPADVAAQRNFDRRPCLTINKLPTFLNQITNDQRQNRPSINVSPVGDRGDPEAAKMFRGMIRAIERDSCADIAYDTAFADAAGIGEGYWLITTEYAGDDTFNQVLRIKRIRNRFTVYTDPDSQDPTGADMKFAFITTMVPRDEYEQQWPDADPMSFNQAALGEKGSNWMTKDAVRIAEYYEIRNEMRELVLLSNGFEGWKDGLSDEIKAKIKSGEIEIEKERQSPCPKVTWYKVNAVEILESTPWLGRSIPIVKVTGNEIDVEGKLKLSGMIRNAKQSQLMYNYGRALGLNTPLPTPQGWTTMGDVKEGDELIDEQGKPCNVLGTSAVHLFHDCYRLTFDDGSEIVADGDHLWQVEDRGNRRIAGGWDWKTKIVRTTDIDMKRHIILAARPIELADAVLPIHPYLLGAWLGDGIAAEPCITENDDDINEIRSTIGAFGDDVGRIRKYDHRVGEFTIHGVRKNFSDLGLLGNKHIPQQYLRASRKQREMLLQGLMDTDGTVGRNRQCAFCTTNARLADQFAELLRSLGIKAVRAVKSARMQKMPGGYVSPCAEAYIFSFSCGPDDNVFRLARKVKRVKTDHPFHAKRTKRHTIVSIEAVPSVAVKCVKVDSPSHLYLAGEAMIPTHNTTELEVMGLQPKAPFIGAEGQFEGHESEWKQANTSASPYLTYKPESLGGQLLPPPQRQAFPNAPTGIIQFTQTAAQDMMATTGIRFDATMQERTIDESGRALREIRRTGDLTSFHYIDNLCRSFKRCGEILIDLIPKTYDTKQIVTILRDDDKEETIQIDPAAPKATMDQKYPANHPTKPNRKLKIFNPTIGKYGVTVTTGPSYATKRIEASESMADFARAMPGTAEVFVDIIARNQDWPGAEEIATRLAKLVAQKFPQVMTPDLKDVPPEVQAVLGSMDMQIKQLMQERLAMMKTLGDQQTDRALELQKINNDYEAKLLKIVADIETKTASTQEKAVANFNTHIASRIDDLAGGVLRLQAELTQKPGDEEAGGVTGALQAMHERLDGIEKSSRRPRRVRILRGEDGLATGAEIDDADAAE